jgi:type IV secretory pathway VirD2 relaxase
MIGLQVNAHGDLPIFKPRFGGGRRPTERSGASSLRNALLCRLRRMSASSRKAASVRSSVAVKSPGAGARRVIIKAHVQRMGPGAAKAAALYLRYIERDGVEKDGSKAMLYTADGLARSEAFQEPRLGEKHQFRLIVSPEDAGELDLTDFIRRYMKRVEKDLGCRLEWAAVNHYDTDHPHAHIVIRGVDRDGRELRLDRGYISNGMRWRAQELATEELGPRLELDVKRTYAKEMEQNRFTSLDRELERRCEEGRIDVRSGKRGARIDDSTLLARLEHLEGLRLAERLSPASWKLADGWTDRLRELGSRGDILKQIHVAMSGNPTQYQIVRPGQALPARGDGSHVVSGRVVSKGLSDELKGRFFAVIESPTGAAYHVALDARSAQTVRPGDIVSFTTKPEPAVLPIDRQIAQTARAHGGVFPLAPANDAGPNPHERRLREFARMGLARVDGPGRWKVSPDLVQELEKRHAEAPARHRLLLHKEPLSLESQIHHRGVVWLDRGKTQSLAPYGFGAKLRRAAEQRREVLRHLGIRPEDPDRIARLREVERRAVGKEIAAQCGQVFVPDSRDGFRGRVRVANAPGDGRAYAIVSDGSRFVVLHATASLRLAQGKQITIGRDAKGRVLVRTTSERGLKI